MSGPLGRVPKIIVCPPPRDATAANQVKGGMLIVLLAVALGLGLVAFL